MDRIIDIISLRPDGMRHEYTINHQYRVSILSFCIGKRMALLPKEVEDAGLAGLVHDVGKNNIPIDLLDKADDLIDHEWDEIKTHPIGGYSILEKGVNLSLKVKESVLQHHERIDGTGYPNKLTGDKISVIAKIVSVADVIDAMSIHRPYKPTYGIDKALVEIATNKGIKYDPIVVDVCLELFNLSLFSFNTNTARAFAQQSSYC